MSKFNTSALADHENNHITIPSSGADINVYRERGCNPAFRAIASAGLCPQFERSLRSLATHAGPTRARDCWRHARVGECVSFEPAHKAAVRIGTTVRAIRRAVHAGRSAGILEVRQAGRGARLYVWSMADVRSDVLTDVLTYKTPRTDPRSTQEDPKDQDQDPPFKPPRFRRLIAQVRPRARWRDHVRTLAGRFLLRQSAKRGDPLPRLRRKDRAGEWRRPELPHELCGRRSLETGGES